MNKRSKRKDWSRCECLLLLKINMIKRMKQSNILCQVQCQRWGSWGERYCLQKQFCRKDKVQVWFFAWLKMMTGLISMLTHQYTLTHCLRCNSGWRGWRGRSIDLSGGRKVIIVWSQPFKLQSFSSFIVLCLLDILIGLTAYFKVWSEASSEGHWSREEGKRSSDPGDWLEFFDTQQKEEGKLGKLLSSN